MAWVTTISPQTPKQGVEGWGSVLFEHGEGGGGQSDGYPDDYCGGGGEGAFKDDPSARERVAAAATPVTRTIPSGVLMRGSGVDVFFLVGDFHCVDL